MPAVTQLTPNFLGGVSRQNDDKKFPGQLTECINGLPDATYGLTKRPGMKFINSLKKADGTKFTKSELADAVWFSINRDEEKSYIGAIKGSNIYVWTADTGTFCTVTNNSSSYLSGSNYHFRSIQDTTIITNQDTTCVMQDKPTFVKNSEATLKLISIVSGDVHKVKIQYQATTPAVATATVQGGADYESFLSGTHVSHDLFGAIKDKLETAQTGTVQSEFTGHWYLESYKNSIVIRRTDGNGANAVITDYSTPVGTPLPFFIRVLKAGVNNASLERYRFSADDVSKLALESFHGRIVKIRNDDGPDDNYFLKFVADNGVNGPGHWEETISPTVSVGFNASTFPHQLLRTADTTFVFSSISYVNRAAGDDTTNPPPSIFTKDDTAASGWNGKKIKSTFFYSNRFGFLSNDNIIFSQANSPYNFFAKSALIQVNGDPIDLNVSSTKPVVLNDVLPSSQGLLIFSEQQQFQLYSSDAYSLTPTNCGIRSVSNYEMNPNVSPVDIGNSSVFLSSAVNSSRLFSLGLRDIGTPPDVTDISKTVFQWLPSNIDNLFANPQTSSIILKEKDSSYFYIFRYFNSGSEDNQFQAWVKWQVTGLIQTSAIFTNDLTVVTQHKDEYTLSSVSLDELPTGDVVATSTGITGNPCLDMATRPVQPAGGVNAVVYDSTNNITKIYVPFTPFDNKKGIMLFATPVADVGTSSAVDADAGYYLEATARTEVGTGYYYFEVKGDQTSYADGIVIGYSYDFEATLPKFYFRVSATETDFTSSLTISRVKFSIGTSGPILFSSKADGSDEWKNIEYATNANSYQANSPTVQNQQQFTVPIHQRNTNFELKVTSNYPYPVTLVSMMWEGVYSPRFYRRA